MFKKLKTIQYSINDILHPIEVPNGQVFIQQSPARTGKSERARKWMNKDQEIRRVVDGDVKYAIHLANGGFAVVLNLLPGMSRGSLVSDKI
jgi:hypothetical protein